MLNGSKICSTLHSNTMCNLTFHLVGRSIIFLAVVKASRPVDLYRLKELLCIFSILFLFSRETSKESCADAAFWKFLSDCPDKFCIALERSLTVHGMNDFVITALERNVKIRKDPLIFLDKLKNIGIKVVRVNVKKTNPELSLYL